MVEKLKELRSELVEFSRKVFTEMLNRRPDEHFYAFALLIHEDMESLVAGANTQEALERTLKKYAKQGDNFENDPAFPWFCNEWSYEENLPEEDNDNIGELLEEITSVIDYDEDDAEEQSLELWDRVIDTMIDALKELDKEGLFGLGAEREKITLFITMNDSDDIVELENRSAKVLNPKSVYSKFSKRYKRRKKANAKADKKK